MPSQSLCPSAHLRRMKILSAALPQMMTMMMMMMLMVCVFGGPLPAPCGRLRCDVNVSNPHLPADRNNATRFMALQDIMLTLVNHAWSAAGNILENDAGNSTDNRVENKTLFTLFGISFARCILPTCGTANLGSAMQVGDERAGSATRDPHGPGKK